MLLECCSLRSKHGKVRIIANNYQSCIVKNWIGSVDELWLLSLLHLLRIMSKSLEVQ